MVIIDKAFLRALGALVVLGLCLGVTTSSAAVDCAEGVSAAQLVNDPLGDWLYVVNVTWDTGRQNGLGHLDIFLGLCSCADSSAFATTDTSGYSSGSNGGASCVVYYNSEGPRCGDPSIPGANGPLIKFASIDTACKPGRTGNGTFWFYSDFPPADVGTPNGFLAIKAGQGTCFGQLKGQMPSCEFNASESKTWGRIKGVFR